MFANIVYVFTCSSLLTQDGSTALSVAAQNGHLRVVEMLIAAKALVNLADKVQFWVIDLRDKVQIELVQWNLSITHLYLAETSLQRTDASCTNWFYIELV